MAAYPVKGSTPWDVTLKAYIDDADAQIPSSDQSGTSYTLALTDAGKVVRATNAAATTITVPDNATVAFPVGTIVNIYAAGAGGVTIAAAGGVTIRNSVTSLDQFEEVSIRKDGTDEWVMVGTDAAPATTVVTVGGVAETVDETVSATYRRYTNAAAVTVTLPVGIAAGVSFIGRAAGAGGVTIQNDGTSVVNGGGSIVQNKEFRATSVGSDTWDVAGVV